MSTCKQVKIDSNSVGFNYTEEKCLGEKPESTATWQALEPNSLSLNSELTTVQRMPFSQGRQNKKGTPTGLSVSGNFEMDFTQNNWTDLLQGILYADKRAKANGAVTAVTTTGFTLAEGGTKFRENDMILATGFTNITLNKVHTVGAGSTDTEVKVAGLTVATDKGNIQVVGHRFAAGDLKFNANSNIYKITSTAKNLTELGLIQGEWIFVGGDNANNRFANVKPFYGRVSRVTANEISFTDGTFDAGLSSDNGAGKEIEIYVGTVIKNENTLDLIKRRSYTFERTLGKDLSTNQGQSDYAHGCVLGEFELNVGQEEMLKATCNFTGTEHTFHKGDALSKDKLTPSLGESGINTSNDIRALKLSIRPVHESTSNPLFAYLTELSLKVNNNLSENKALGVFGAIDISAGNIEISGSVKAYFDKIEAVEAVRNNADVGLSLIFARANAGFMFDVPLIGLGGGQIEVEKDQPITISLEANGAENEFGYTIMYVNFAQLPTVAM